MDAMTSRKQDVLQVLRKVSRGRVSTIHPDTALSELGLDSLDRVEFLFELERLFDVEISDDHGLAMKTIVDVLAFVEALSSERST